MSNEKRSSKGFTLIELMIVVTIIGILASIALPSFTTFLAQSRQAEPKAMLKTWFSTQRSYFAEKSAYTESFVVLGFSPERGNRYGYGFAATCSNYEVRLGVTVATDSTANCITVDQAKFPSLSLIQTPNVPAQTYSGGGGNPGSPAGLGGTCPNCNIQAYAAGNIDNDLGVDTWIISTVGSTFSAPGCGIASTAVGSGIPTHAFNDVNCN